VNERESARSTFENQDSGALERDSHADFALPARHGTRMRGDRRPEETLLPRCPALDNAVDANPFDPTWDVYFEERELHKEYGPANCKNDQRPVVKAGPASAGL
jgi:hypothetical protein